MATQPDNPRGEQSVDNICSSSKEFSEHPKVEEENFLTPPSTAAVHFQVNNQAVEVGEESEMKEGDKLDDPHARVVNHTGTEEEENNIKSLSEEKTTSEAVDLQKQSFETCPSIVSSSIEEGSVDAVLQEVTSEYMEVPENLSIGEAHYEINHTDSLLLSPKLDDQAVEEILKKAEESEINGDSGRDDARVVSVLPAQTTSENTLSESHGDVELEDGPKLDDKSENEGEREDAELLENEPNTTCTSLNENIQLSNLNQENKEEEETIDARLQSCPPIDDSSSLEEGSKNALGQEGTTEYKDQEIIEFPDQNLSIGEADYEINNVAPEISELDVKSNQTVIDGTDTLLLSQLVEVDEIQQNAEESDAGPSVVTSEINLGEKLDDPERSMSHGDEECKSQRLEEAATDLGEKVEESTIGQVGERHPLTTEDNVAEAINEADLSENEQSRRGSLVIEQPAESLHVAPESIEVSDSCQENNIGCLEEQNTNGNDQQKESLESFPQQVTRDHLEVLENLSTTLSTEDADKDDLVKESEEMPLAREISEFEDGDSKKAELCDNDTSMLLENTQDLLHATSEDSTTSDVGQEIETSGMQDPQESREKISDEGRIEPAEAKEESLENEKTEDNEEHSEVKIEDGKPSESILLSENPSESLHAIIPDVDHHIEADNSQGIPSDATTTIQEAQELQNVSNEESHNALEMKHDTNLERPSVTDASKEDSTILLTPKTADECLSEVELPNDEKSTDCDILKNAPEDHKTSTSSEGNKELALENVATETSHEHIEDNSASQVDCDKILEKESQNSSFTEAPIEETNFKDGAEESIKYQTENEENTESTCVQEETEGKKLTDTLQEKPEDVKHDSTPGISDKEEEHIVEQILTADTQESRDQTEETTVDAADEKNDVVINEDNSPAEVDDSSQKPSSEEVDEEPTAISEDKVANENTVKANPFEVECGLVKEEVYVESPQVANEDREESHLEEHAPTTMDDQKDGKADPEEETLDYKNHATTDSPIQVDKITSSADDGKDSTLVTEVPEIEYPVDSSLEATEDIIPSDSCQDAEISSTEKQIPDLEDISSNIITEVTTEATGEEIQDIAKSVPQEEDSPEVEDDSQKSSLVEGTERNIDKHESTSELLKNEKDTEDTLINEDVSTELLHVATDDIKGPFLSQVAETNSQEEEILHANPAGLTDDNRIIDEKDTPAEEVAKEIESGDVKATPTELKEEEGYLNDLQMTTAAHQDKSSDLTSEKTPSAEDLDVNKDIIHDHDTSTESGLPEKNDDQVDEEAKSCGDKTDSEKIQFLDDGSVAVPTDETLAETDTGSTEVEVQVPHGEKDAVLILQEAEIDQKHIKETLLSNNASEDVSELEEKIDSNNCEVDKQESEVQVPESSVEQIETADHKDSVVEEGEINKEDIGQQKQNEKTTDGTKPTEEELEEPVANDSVQEEPCTLKAATEDDEKEAYEEHIANINNSDNIINANEKTSVESILVNERSDTDLETRNDEEAPQTKETTLLSAQGQGVEEHSTPDSNEAAFTPVENKTASVTQVQNYDIISEKEENLKAEIISDKAVGEDVFHQEETGCEKEILQGDILSEKEQLLRSEADQGSCEEVITESHQDDEVKQEQQKNNNETFEFLKDGNEAEKVQEDSEEANDKVPEDLEDEVKQEQQENNNETVEFIKDGNETEMASEVSEEKVLTNEVLHQEEQPKSIEKPTTDTGKARELDIASVCDTSDSVKEGVQIAISPGEESEEQKDEVQPKDEENTMLLEGKSEADTWTKPNEGEDKEAYIESKKLDFTSESKDISECTVRDGAQDIPEDNHNTTTINKLCKEDDPRRSTEFEVSAASEDIAVTEQASEATTVSAEVQEAKATAVESPEVEEVNDKCKELTDTSIAVEPPVISVPKVIPECTRLEAEDLETKLHDNIRDSEVKIAEKDDAVNLHSLRDISEHVQESSKESFEVSNHDNTLERDPEEKIETSERQETKPIENAPVSEAEEQKLGRGSEDVHEEEKKIYCIPNLLESSSSPETEKVPESSIHQSSVEDTAQPDRSQQIDSQQATSHVKTSEKDLLHVAGLEADDKKNSTPENLGGEKNLSAEYLQGEYEVVKPSKVKQEEAECGSEEQTDQKREGKPEPKDPTRHNEELHENSKTDEEKDDEEESHEQKMEDLVSEAAVMVDMGDADVKVAHKKSHNILSGVGSKVKHSIAKVKKAITGKSSHPKTPSPQKGDN